MLQGMVITAATEKAVATFSRIPSVSSSTRDSLMAGTRLMESAAVRMVDMLMRGTAMPVRYPNRVVASDMDQPPTISRRGTIIISRLDTMGSIRLDMETGRARAISRLMIFPAGSCSLSGTFCSPLGKNLCFSRK